MYIYQQSTWPNFRWDDKALLLLISKVRNLQGKLIGKMEAIGFSLREEAMLKMLTIDIIKTNQIEGEHMDMDEVRSSIARRLGMEVSGLVPSARKVEGFVEMMLDVAQGYKNTLSKERLCNWHAALFPTGRSGMYKITVGDWRKDETGAMQVVSGAMGRERVHYEAPSANVLEKEMTSFVQWFNEESVHEPVIKSGIAHLWFITIHPFDDGNGRVARAIADMQLARADNTSQRFYSLSTQIEQEKKRYYEILEETQKGNLDITEWLEWYLQCLVTTLEATEGTLNDTLKKAEFWKNHATTHINPRQKIMINKLLDDFYGKLTTSKWAKMTKSSQDTALRDIQDLVNKNILKKENGGGRSTSYVLVLKTK